MSSTPGLDFINGYQEVEVQKSFTVKHFCFFSRNKQKYLILSYFCSYILYS